MDRDARSYLWDVQQAAEAVGQFTAGLDAVSYAQNALVRSAVERQFEIIGESLNQLSKRTLRGACRICARSSGFGMS